MRAAALTFAKPVPLKVRPGAAAFALFAIVGSLIASEARADDYPVRTVTIVAPSAPGGLYSLFARIIADKLEHALNGTFIVENRPGAASVVGATYVAHAVPDGYTLMIANSTTMATNVTLHRSLPYNPATDFTPIILIARIPEVLVVNAALPVHSIAELVALAKETDGGLSFGSAGVGTAQHLDGEMLKTLLGIAMTHVPYRGMAPAINDVAGGHIPLMFSPITLALPLINAGKLRPLGVTARERIDALPDVLPLADIGVPGYDASSWFMLVAPAQTPQPVIDKLYGTLGGLTGDADIKKQFNDFGLLPVTSPPPAELKSFVQSEVARWSTIVKKAGLEASE
jgi:tripartite-type tricarboxylate transporter receptor subunit TctC